MIDQRPKQKRHVLLVDNRGESRIVLLNEKAHLNWRKINIELSKVLQYPYYQRFEVNKNSLVPVETPIQDSASEEELEVEGNNEHMYRLDEAQHLKPEDIKNLKKSLRPEQLIEQLASNNEQFNQRTSYSKEKYLRKKKLKYLFHITPMPPTISDLHRHYYKDNPELVASLRWDTLALLLLHGAPFHNVLIAEEGKGVLTASILQRGAKTVTLVGAAHAKVPRFAEELNLPRQSCLQRLSAFKWDSLAECNKTFSNVLMAGSINYPVVLLGLVQKMEAGCKVCLFGLSQTLMVEAMTVMRQSKQFVNVRLFDTWAREFQVLKNRTHPLMSMDSCSGYLLVGIRVTNPTGSAAIAPPQQTPP